MPHSVHKSHFLNAVYPRSWKRLSDMLPEELPPLKMISSLSLIFTTLIIRVQIICSVQIADFASQVTITHLNTRGISGEEVGVVCELIVIEAVFPLVECCYAVISYWFKALRGKIGIGTSVGDDVS